MEEPLLSEERNNSRNNQRKPKPQLENNLDFVSSVLCEITQNFCDESKREFSKQEKNFLKLVKKLNKLKKQAVKRFKKILKKNKVYINSCNECGDTAPIDILGSGKGENEGSKYAFSAIALEIYRDAGGDIDRVNLFGESPRYELGM